MPGEAAWAKRVAESRPVCHDFEVPLADGQHGSVQESRLGDEGVGGDVEAVGGIVRMPVRHSSRAGAPRKHAP